jgi:hypothetical protein
MHCADVEITRESEEVVEQQKVLKQQEEKMVSEIAKKEAEVIYAENELGVQSTFAI